MLVVSLVTLGSPEQLTGGYLYHRRMADAAPGFGAKVEFTSARPMRNPLGGVGADVVLVDSIAAARAAPWAGARARRPRRPLAAVLHQPPGGIDHGRIRAAAQAPLDRWLYRRCKLLLAASGALADELVTVHRLDRARVRVVAPGSDVAPAPAQVPELRHGRGAAFVSVGNWVARKGTLDLLEAFAPLAPGLATLHLAGRDDVEPGYTARVRARLAASDLADRVVVHGPVSRDEVVVVVTHVSPIKAAIAWGLGVPHDVAWRMWVEDASVCRLDHGPHGPVLRWFNRQLAPAL